MYEKTEIERSKLRGIQPGRPGLMNKISINPDAQRQLNECEAGMRGRRQSPFEAGRALICDERLYEAEFKSSGKRSERRFDRTRSTVDRFIRPGVSYNWRQLA